MNTKQKRLALIGGGLAIAAAAVGFSYECFPGQPCLLFFAKPGCCAKEAPEGGLSESRRIRQRRFCSKTV